MKVATLCYVRQAGKTLMIHRTKRADDMHHGKWNGLGGKLLSGETPEECAAREIREESGLQVVSMRFKGLLTFPKFANDEDWYAFVFVVDSFSGGLKESAEGYLAWIDDARLYDLELWEGDRYFLPWLDQPGFFSAKFVYEGGTYISHEVKFYG